MGVLALFLAISNKKFLITASDPDVTNSAEEIWDLDKRVQGVNSVSTIVLTPDQSIVMAELELREEALFESMSKAEQDAAIKMVNRINEIKLDLEQSVKKANPSAKHIFIEFVDGGGN